MNASHDKNGCATSGTAAAPLVLAPVASTPLDTPPAILTAMPTPSCLFAAFRRRWLLTMTISVCAAVLGAIAVWNLPVTCRVRTLLHVASYRPFILYDLPDKFDFSIYQRSQITLVRSRLVLNHALQDPSVAALKVVANQPHPLIWLEKILQVDFQNGPEILSISIIGDQTEPPESWITLVDAVRESYLKEIVNKEKTQRQAKLDQLHALYTKYDNLLREKRDKLNELAVSLGSRKSQGIQLKQKFMYTQLEDLHKEFMQLQSQTRKLQVELQAIQTNQKILKDAPLPPEKVDERLNQEPEIQKLLNQEPERQAKLQSLKDRLRNSESDPAFLAESAALASLQETLAMRRATLRREIEQQLREEMLAQSNSSLITNKAQLAVVQQLESVLTAQIKKQTESIDAVGKESVSFDWLDEEIAYAAEVHKRIGTQKEALQVETEAPSRIVLLESAYAVSTRDKNERLKTAGMAGCGLFGLALFLVPLLEFRSRRISTVSEVVHGLGFSLVGSLPRVPARILHNRRALTSDGRWRRALTESVDAARTMLVHAARRQGLRVIMVTSAVKGEGKTLLASHLAISLARGGFRTLLIDADLRHPSVHRQFNLPVAPGLGEFLRGELRLPSVFYKNVAPCLSLVTAGHWDESITTLLAQPNLRTFFKKLTKYFDFILVDTTPVLPVPDAMLIAQNVDAVLFSVLRDVSRLTTVYSAYERLATLDIPILGAVVAGTTAESYGSEYARPTVNQGR